MYYYYSNIEGYPMYFAAFVYFVFSFFALYELHKLGSDFVLRRSLIITLYISIVLLVLTVIGNTTPFVKCHKIIRYIPHDSLLQIFSCVFNYSHISYPVSFILYFIIFKFMLYTNFYNFFFLFLFFNFFILFYFTIFYLILLYFILFIYLISFFLKKNFIKSFFF